MIDLTVGRFKTAKPKISLIAAVIVAASVTSYSLVDRVGVRRADSIIKLYQLVVYHRSLHCFTDIFSLPRAVECYIFENLPAGILRRITVCHRLCAGPLC